MSERGGEGGSFAGHWRVVARLVVWFYCCICLHTQLSFEWRREQSGLREMQPCQRSWTQLHRYMHRLGIKTFTADILTPQFMSQSRDRWVCSSTGVCEREREREREGSERTAMFLFMCPGRSCHWHGDEHSRAQEGDWGEAAAMPCVCVCVSVSSLFHVQESVMKQVDHKHLDKDVPFFKNHVR